MSLVLMAQSVLVLSVCAPGEEPLPGAQAGTLYPLIRATADRSTSPMSFLRPGFADVEAWKAEARPAVRSLLHYDPPHCDPAADVLERVDCGDYVRERIEFNTTPDIRVPACVLVPKLYLAKRWALIERRHWHVRSGWMYALSGNCLR